MIDQELRKNLVNVSGHLNLNGALIRGGLPLSDVSMAKNKSLAKIVHKAELTMASLLFSQRLVNEKLTDGSEKISTDPSHFGEEQPLENLYLLAGVANNQEQAHAMAILYEHKMHAFMDKVFDGTIILTLSGLDGSAPPSAGRAL